MLVAFITGGLVLSKYRGGATKGYRTMAIIGMLLAGLMLLATLVVILLVALGLYGAGTGL